VTGTVRSFRDERGYGFITSDDGEDIFFHHTAIQMAGYRRLDSGQRVEFDMESTPRGPQAFNVVPLGPPPFQYGYERG
jgi:CspA family cold shock protein